MGYIDVLLLFSSFFWHFVVVLAVVAPNGGLCSGQLLFRGSLGHLFCIGFGVPLQPFWFRGV